MICWHPKIIEEEECISWTVNIEADVSGRRGGGRGGGGGGGILPFNLNVMSCRDICHT